MNITLPNVFVDLTLANADEVNANFDEISNKFNTYAVQTDVAKTITATHTMTAAADIIKIVPTPNGVYGTRRFFCWYHADGVTPRTYVGFLADNDTTFSVSTAEATDKLQFQTGAFVTALELLNDQTAVFTAAVYAGASSGLGWTGSAFMESPADGIVALYNAAETGFNRLQFGGTTSSFPALQRSGTGIVVRLADDSANAPLTCAAFTATTVSCTTLTGTGALTGFTTGVFSGNVTVLTLTVGANQVVGARRTGWTDQTATAARTNLGVSPTVGALASFCRALYDDLKVHGLIGN